MHHIYIIHTCKKISNSQVYSLLFYVPTDACYLTKCGSTKTKYHYCTGDTKHYWYWCGCKYGGWCPTCGCPLENWFNLKLILMLIVNFDWKWTDSLYNEIH